MRCSSFFSIADRLVTERCIAPIVTVISGWDQMKILFIESPEKPDTLSVFVGIQQGLYYLTSHPTVFLMHLIILSLEVMHQMDVYTQLGLKGNDEAPYYR